MAKKTLSLIIPAFNEEKRLPKKFLNSYNFLKKNVKNFEIIFVNDGSLDGTEKLIKDLSKNYRNIVAVSYRKNRGKGYALRQGLKKAKGEIIGFTDADFAVDLNGIPSVIEKIGSGIDLVIGNRNSITSRVKGQTNLNRRFSSKVLRQLNRFFLPLKDIEDIHNGFKFFKREVAKDIFPRLTIDRFLFDTQLLTFAKEKNYKIFQQPVVWQEIGESKVRLYKDLPTIIKDLIKIYSQYMSTNFFVVILGVLLIAILLPFLINPESLTRRNGDFSDLVWPDYYFIKESVNKYGEIPLWNPTLFSGIPEIANPQSPLIYPPNALALILSIDLAIVLLFFLHALIGGTYFYKLSKEILKWPIDASVAATFTFIFSPFFWTKIAVGHVSQIFAIFLVAPMLYFGAEFLQTNKIKYLILLSITLAMQYLNYPTIWYFSCFFGGIFLILAFWRRIVNPNLFILTTPILSLLLIFPIFIQHLKAGPLITRSILSLNDLAIPFWSISRFIKSIFIPSNLYPDNETEVWLYPSIIALSIGFFGLSTLKRDLKIIISSLLILIIMITLGSRTPVFEFLSQNFPGFSYLRVSTRDWFVFVVILSFLVGWGFKKIKYRKLILALLLFDLIIFSSLRIWFVPSFMDPKSAIDLRELLPADKNYRIYCTNRCLSARETLPEGISTADGYHLVILKDYRVALSDAGGFDPPEYTGNIPTYSVSTAQPSAEKLGKMAVKWVISKNPLTDKNFIPITEQNGFTLYENKLAKKRIRFQTKSENNILIKLDSPNKIELQTSGEADNLIIADSYYPNWKAKIDGKDVNIEKYEGWARLIKVPERNHRIILEFSLFK